MKAQVISFQCVLKNKLGRIISTSTQSEVINSVSHASDLRDLALGLQDVRVGEKRQIEIKAERAYGFYKPELCGEMPRHELARGFSLAVGDTLPLYSPERKCSMEFRVIAADGHSVTVDANHPLAGQDLFFEVDILDAREMTESDHDGDESAEPKNRVLH